MANTNSIHSITGEIPINPHSLTHLGTYINNIYPNTLLSLLHTVGLRQFGIQIASIANVINLQLQQSAIQIAYANASIKYTAIYMAFSMLPMMAVSAVTMAWVSEAIDSVITQIIIECVLSVINGFASATVVDILAQHEAGINDYKLRQESMASGALGGLLGFPIFMLHNSILNSLGNRLLGTSKVVNWVTPLSNIAASTEASLATAATVSKIYNQKFDPGEAAISGAVFGAASIIDHAVGMQMENNKFSNETKSINNNLISELNNTNISTSIRIGKQITIQDGQSIIKGNIHAITQDKITKDNYIDIKTKNNENVTFTRDDFIKNLHTYDGYKINRTAIANKINKNSIDNRAIYKDINNNIINNKNLITHNQDTNYTTYSNNKEIEEIIELPELSHTNSREPLINSINNDDNNSSDSASTTNSEIVEEEETIYNNDNNTSSYEEQLINNILNNNNSEISFHTATDIVNNGEIIPLTQNQIDNIIKTNKQENIILTDEHKAYNKTIQESLSNKDTNKLIELQETNYPGKPDKILTNEDNKIESLATNNNDSKYNEMHIDLLPNNNILLNKTLRSYLIDRNNTPFWYYIDQKLMNNALELWIKNCPTYNENENSYQWTNEQITQNIPKIHEILKKKNERYLTVDNIMKQAHTNENLISRFPNIPHIKVVAGHEIDHLISFLTDYNFNQKREILLIMGCKSIHTVMHLIPKGHQIIISTEDIKQIGANITTTGEFRLYHGDNNIPDANIPHNNNIDYIKDKDNNNYYYKNLGSNLSEGLEHITAYTGDSIQERFKNAYPESLNYKEHTWGFNKKDIERRISLTGLTNKPLFTKKNSSSSSIDKLNNINNVNSINSNKKPHNGIFNSKNKQQSDTNDIDNIFNNINNLNPEININNTTHKNILSPILKWNNTNSNEQFTSHQALKNLAEYFIKDYHQHTDSSHIKFIYNELLNRHKQLQNNNRLDISVHINQITESFKNINNIHTQYKNMQDKLSTTYPKNLVNLHKHLIKRLEKELIKTNNVDNINRTIQSLHKRLIRHNEVLTKYANYKQDINNYAGHQIYDLLELTDQDKNHIFDTISNDSRKFRETYINAIERINNDNKILTLDKKLINIDSINEGMAYTIPNQNTINTQHEALTKRINQLDKLYQLLDNNKNIINKLVIDKQSINLKLDDLIIIKNTNNETFECRIINIQSNSNKPDNDIIIIETTNNETQVKLQRKQLNTLIIKHNEDNIQNNQLSHHIKQIITDIDLKFDNNDQAIYNAINKDIIISKISNHFTKDSIKYINDEFSKNVDNNDQFQKTLENLNRLIDNVSKYKEIRHNSQKFNNILTEYQLMNKLHNKITELNNNYNIIKSNDLNSNSLKTKSTNNKKINENAFNKLNKYTDKLIKASHEINKIEFHKHALNSLTSNGISTHNNSTHNILNIKVDKLADLSKLANNYQKYNQYIKILIRKKDQFAQLTNLYPNTIDSYNTYLEQSHTNIYNYINSDSKIINNKTIQSAKSINDINNIITKHKYSYTIHKHTIDKYDDILNEFKILKINHNSPIPIVNNRTITINNIINDKHAIQNKELINKTNHFIESLSILNKHIKDNNGIHITTINKFIELLEEK